MNTYRDTDHVGLDASLDLLVSRQLLVGRRRGVDDERLGIANVGQVRSELDAVDEGLGRVESTLAAKAQHRAKAVLAEVLLRVCVASVAGERRVANPRHLVVRREELRDRVGVVGVCLQEMPAERK